MRCRRLRRWAAFWGIVLIAAVLAGLPVFVQPQTDSLRRADAVLILGGPGWDRYPFGVELAVDGWSSTVAISNPDGAKDPWLTKTCDAPPRGLTFHCFAPSPPTTLGEARELQRLSRSLGWHTVIVVTFRPHISRARYILERCFEGDLVMVASPAQLSVGSWAAQYVYQTAGYVRSVLQPPC